MGEGSVEIPGLLRDAPPLLLGQEVERTHVVQPIGELDDDDPRVFGDREQQLAVALDLPLLRRPSRGQLGNLRQAVDDARDLAGGSTQERQVEDRKSTRLNSSHSQISYADFRLKIKF